MPSPPGGAGRGARCPRAERRGPAWRAGEARRGGAGQAAEPGLPEGLAGPLRSARQRRRPGASAEPPPLGAAPDGAPPPAPRELPPPASPVPGGSSPALRGGNAGSPVWRHRLPCPDLQSRRGTGRPREEPRRAAFLAPQPPVPSGMRFFTPACLPEGYDRRPTPSRLPRDWDPLPHACREEREGIDGSCGTRAVGPRRSRRVRGTRGPLPPASPVRDRGCRPLGAPGRGGPGPAPPPRAPRPRCCSSLPELWRAARGAPAAPEQRLLRPSGLSRRGRGFPLEKSGVVSVWRLSASFPGQRRAPRAAAFQGCRPKETSGNGNPIPRGPRQTVPGDSCGVCHRGEPVGVSVGENAEGSVNKLASGRDRRFLADTAAARSVVQVEKLSVGFISTFTLLCMKKKK
ncbi:collagen alpha-1(I) chain-like [Ammospiza nelsoni]|uniref:collagen alpha-1(I) chain-like n=1 Tax=Ammospiza nelsoni TaxID=2857394 RepID=UPI002869901C|nr:collagen alpha-1(I) chain-like [Ammospiza nelsoni]